MSCKSIAFFVPFVQMRLLVKMFGVSVLQAARKGFARLVVLRYTGPGHVGEWLGSGAQ